MRPQVRTEAKAAKYLGIMLVSPVWQLVHVACQNMLRKREQKSRMLSQNPSRSAQLRDYSFKSCGLSCNLTSHLLLPSCLGHNPPKKR